MRRTLTASVVLVLAVLPTVGATGSAPPSGHELVERHRRPGDAPLDPVLAALAAGRLERRPPPPTAGALEPPPVSLGYVLTGPELAPFEVSGTETAGREVAAFEARLRGRGIDPAGTSWRVFALPSIREATEAAPGETDAESGPLTSSLVVPRDTTVGIVGAIFEHGRLYVKTTITATAQPPVGVMSMPGDSMKWQPAGERCIDRKQNATAWYDPCQKFFWLNEDGDPFHHFWAAQYFGTGKSKGAWTLAELEAAGWRSKDTARQEWVDWDPGADGHTANCEAQSVGVAVAGIGVSVEKQHCELWDIAKGAEPADLANWWRGMAHRSERETAATTATRTRNGDLPTDDFDFDYYAHMR